MWAVRSSGVAEDLGDASYAGRYDTVLGVISPEEVLEAVERVRRSAGSEQAETYRTHHAQ